LRRISLAALAALALAGCHAVRYDAGRPASPRRWEKTIHFWAWGFGGAGRVDLDAACPEGVASFKSEATALGWVAQVVTIGFWSPRRVTVTCADGPGPRVAAAEDGR
jgi:ABC-type glycerol-3-phosphate transport system substrate-binding protein